MPLFPLSKAKNEELIIANMDYETYYAALELQFGAGLKEVNERWRKLSRIHHPDHYARDPKKTSHSVGKTRTVE